MRKKRAALIECTWTFSKKLHFKPALLCGQTGGSILDAPKDRWKLMFFIQRNALFLCVCLRQKGILRELSFPPPFPTRGLSIYLSVSHLRGNNSAFTRRTSFSENLYIMTALVYTSWAVFQGNEKILAPDQMCNPSSGLIADSIRHMTERGNPRGHLLSQLQLCSGGFHPKQGERLS